jgi:hypothetical protein
MLALFSRFFRRLKPDGARALKHPIVPTDAVVPLPAGPPGFVAWVLYRYLPDPEMGMLCWEMSNGDLIPFHTKSPWLPDSNWKFEKRTLPLQSANAAKPQPANDSPEERQNQNETKETEVKTS